MVKVSTEVLERIVRGDFTEVTQGHLRALAAEVQSYRDSPAVNEAELRAFADYMLDRCAKARNRPREYGRRPTDRTLGRIEGEEAIASTLSSGNWRRWREAAMVDGRPDRHVARVESDQESIRRGGSCRTAACSCGWVGPQRSSLALAVDDATTHEKGGV